MELVAEGDGALTMAVVESDCCCEPGLERSRRWQRLPGLASLAVDAAAVVQDFGPGAASEDPRPLDAVVLHDGWPSLGWSERNLPSSTSDMSLSSRPRFQLSLAWSKQATKVFRSAASNNLVSPS